MWEAIELRMGIPKSVVGALGTSHPWKDGRLKEVSLNIPVLILMLQFVAEMTLRVNRTF